MTALAHIEAIFSTMQGKVTADMQTPEQAQDYLTELSAWLAFVNEQMPLANRKYNEAKRSAFADLQSRYKAAGEKMTPSLAKEYIETQCSDATFYYEMAERCSRTIVHTMDCMRSVLSSMKSEMNMNRFGGGISHP